jgi:hypothetical protein
VRAAIEGLDGSIVNHALYGLLEASDTPRANAGAAETDAPQNETLAPPVFFLKGPVQDAKLFGEALAQLFPLSDLEAFREPLTAVFGSVRYRALRDEATKGLLARGAASRDAMRFDAPPGGGEFRDESGEVVSSVVWGAGEAQGALVFGKQAESRLGEVLSPREPLGQGSPEAWDLGRMNASLALYHNETPSTRFGTATIVTLSPGDGGLDLRVRLGHDKVAAAVRTIVRNLTMMQSSP